MHNIYCIVSVVSVGVLLWCNVLLSVFSWSSGSSKMRAAERAPLWTALLLLLCVSCAADNSTRRPPENLQEDDSINDVAAATNDYLQVGRSLNLLPRYGFLTLSIKVSSGTTNH